VAVRDAKFSSGAVVRRFPPETRWCITGGNLLQRHLAANNGNNSMYFSPDIAWSLPGLLLYLDGSLANIYLFVTIVIRCIVNYSAGSQASVEYWIHFSERFGGVHAFGLTRPKVNRFGWNLEHSEHIVGGWLWHILGTNRTIRAVATVREAGESLFLSGK